MAAPANPFPLTIDPKQDSWDKAQLLQHIHPTLKVPAAELNLMLDALNYLYSSISTGGYVGNIPIRMGIIDVDHSTAGSTASKVKNAINAMPNYPLENGAAQWFYTQRMVLTSGVGITVGGGAVGYAVITEYFILAKKIPEISGTASVGIGGTAIITGDLVALPPKDTRNLAPQDFDLGNIGSNSIEQAVNTSGPRATPNTATIIFRAEQGGVAKIWLYLGAQENVGIGYPAVGAAAFRIFPADGTGADPEPPTVNTRFPDYDDIPELLLRQREQTVHDIFMVRDASADESIQFAPGATKKQALYKLKSASKTGALIDYILAATPYGNGGTGGSDTPKQVVKTGNYTLKLADNNAIIAMDGGICTIDPNEGYQDGYVVSQKNTTEATNGSIVCTARTGWTYKVNDAASVASGTFSFNAGATCTVIKYPGTQKIYIDGGVE